MKKILLCVIAFTAILGCKTAPVNLTVPGDQQNSDAVPLDTAIREAAALMENRLEAGTKIALLNFSSPSQTFSEYILDELSSVLVNNGVLVVVDRASLDKVRQELNFNMSGEVSDESAQAVGKMLGAEAIVTGRLTSMGDLQRVMFKTIITQSAALAVQHPADIINDKRVQALLAQSGNQQSVSYAENAAPATAAAKPAGPQNGTYTFYPRLQPYKGASLEDGVYLHKIVVRGDYMNIFLCYNETGETARRPAGTWMRSLTKWSDIVLQDLDNPALSYNPEKGSVGTGYDVNDEGIWYPFKGVKSARFSLTNKKDNSAFEEIILGEPDK